MTDAPANDLPTPAEQEELIREISELIKEKGLPCDENEQAADIAAGGCDICTSCILCTYAW